MSPGLGIRADAISAWTALHRGIAECGSTPCEANPDRWAEPATPELAEWAAHRCQQCSVIELCSTFAVANRESAGIWGGQLRTPKRGRPATHQEARTA